MICLQLFLKTSFINVSQLVIYLICGHLGRVVLVKRTEPCTLPQTCSIRLSESGVQGAAFS